jgi:hypothetical protein
MSVQRIIFDRKTHGKLGDDGLTEVQSCLYPVDCQTCGRPLGADTPALVINEMDSWALAELHHRGCRAAEWNAGPVITAPAGNTISWRAESALFPLRSESGEPSNCAMLIVNPSLEAVWL